MTRTRLGRVSPTFDIFNVGYTPGSSNRAIAGKWTVLKMYFLLKNGDIPAIAMSTCQRVKELSKVRKKTVTFLRFCFGWGI